MSELNRFAAALLQDLREPMYFTARRKGYEPIVQYLVIGLRVFLKHKGDYTRDGLYRPRSEFTEIVCLKCKSSPLAAVITLLGECLKVPRREGFEHFCERWL